MALLLKTRNLASLEVAANSSLSRPAKKKAVTLLLWNQLPVTLLLWNHLNAEIGEIVNFHLGCALFKQAQKQTEVKHLEKFRAKTKKALDEVKEELQGAGLMK
jgi:hypothetical protein